MVLRLSRTFLVTAALLVTVGCEKALFTEKLPRTQYERYQILRGQYRPSTEQNAFGAEQPALRERLAPLEQ